MRKPEGVGLTALTTHRLQITAACLLILAGWLWSGRLAQAAYEEQLSAINDSTTEQVELLKRRISEQTDPLTLVATGQSFLESKSPRFAAVVLEQAVKLQPEYRDAWYLLGYSYLELSNSNIEPIHYRTKARNALETALAIDANYQPAKDLLAQLQ